MEISKSDWKLYRKKVAEWQENFMSRLKNDRRHPGVIIEVSKSNAVFDMVRLIRLDVITCNDLVDFSDNLQQVVKELLDRYKE